MIKGFWDNIHMPFLAMAPMADVTDSAFRQMFARYGRYIDEDGYRRGPDVLWTEFVSADGLFKGGYDHLIKDLKFRENERPIVAQFFSREPEVMEKAARLAVELGFDGVDINMGCPVKKIVDQGAGCAMIREPETAQAVIRACQRGAQENLPDGLEPIPVTVKTRIGYAENELETWLPALLEENPVLVSMHARTRNDMSKVAAKWDTIKQCVEIRDAVNPDVLIAGNGDVDSVEEAYERIEETGCDGVMVGRGIFGNPWFFNEHIKREDVTLKKRFEVLLEQARLYMHDVGDEKPFHVLKKHVKAYVSGFEGASELRDELMSTNSPDEMEAVFAEWFKDQDKEW